MAWTFTIDSVDSMDPVVTVSAGTVTWTGPLSGTSVGTAPPQSFFDTEGVGAYSVSSSSGDTDFLTINIAGDNLTAIDVTNATAVTDLRVNSNSLTTIDVTTLTVMTKYFSRVNSLTSDDISNNTSLTDYRANANNFSQGALEQIVYDLWANRAAIGAGAYTYIINNQVPDVSIRGIDRAPSGTGGLPKNAAEARYELVNTYGWTVTVTVSGEDHNAPEAPGYIVPPAARGITQGITKGITQEITQGIL